MVDEFECEFEIVESWLKMCWSDIVMFEENLDAERVFAKRFRGEFVDVLVEIVIIKVVLMKLNFEIEDVLCEIELYCWYLIGELLLGVLEMIEEIDVEVSDFERRVVSRRVARFVVCEEGFECEKVCIVDFLKLFCVYENCF